MNHKITKKQAEKISKYIIKHFSELYSNNLKDIRVHWDDVGFYGNEDTKDEIVWVTEHISTGVRVNFHYNLETKKIHHVMKGVAKRKKDNIKVEGHKGTWYFLNNYVFEGKVVTLLEHEIYGEDAPSIFVKASALEFSNIHECDIVLENVYNGYEDLIENVDKLKEFIKE